MIKIGMLLLVVLSLCFPGAGSAEARVLHVRTLAMSKDPALPAYHLKTEEGYVALPFSHVDPSTVITAFSGADALPLFEPKEAGSKDLEYKIAKSVKIPPGATGVLLLGWMSQRGAEYLAIDDNFLSAKFSDWMLINAADKQVAFQISHDQKPLLIEAGSVKQHRLKVNENVGVSVIGQAKWGEKVRTFYSTYWPVRSKQRSIIIFYNRGERIAVKRVTDMLLKTEER